MTNDTNDSLKKDIDRRTNLNQWFARTAYVVAQRLEKDKTTRKLAELASLL